MRCLEGQAGSLTVAPPLPRWPAHSIRALKGRRALSSRSGLLLLAAIFALPQVTRAQSGEWQVAHGEVRVTCPLTVGGSFEARSQAVAGTLILPSSGPAAFEGGIQVDLRGMDTGIDLRNRHMRENYLEVGRGAGFDHATLTDLVLPDLDRQKPGGAMRFTGQLTVHGVRRPVSGRASIRNAGNTVRVEARFPVRIPDHDIAPPRYLGVGVRDEIEVLVSLTLEGKTGKE